MTTGGEVPTWVAFALENPISQSSLLLSNQQTVAMGVIILQSTVVHLDV